MARKSFTPLIETTLNTFPDLKDNYKKLAQKVGCCERTIRRYFGSSIIKVKKLILIKGFSKEEFNKLFPHIQDFYNSLYWAKCRIFILKRDDFTCLICGKRPSNHVHHWNDPLYYPELCFDPENLNVLCSECHDLYHNRNNTINLR